jgi:hypothetical protein
VKTLSGKLSGGYSPHGEGKFFFTMMASSAISQAARTAKSRCQRDVRRRRSLGDLCARR